LVFNRSSLAGYRRPGEGKRNLGQQLLEIIVSGCKDPATGEATFKAQLEKMIKVKADIGKAEVSG
jgi:hypothetical protein